MPDQPPNRLHRQLARDILLHLRMSAVEPGVHITEVSLQSWLKTSRGPIRAALAHLAAEGYLERRPNKGFFLTRFDDGPCGAIETSVTEDEHVYLQVAEDRFTGRLGERVTEADLMRRYERPRNEIQRVLAKIATEGWIQRRSGYGWSFLPMVDSIESYRESYELRRILEPAGLRLPSFSPDEAVLRDLRDRQDRIHSAGHRTLGQVELFTANSDFHEAIAGMSGNRFIAQAVARQNSLRRLVEYRQTLDRARVRRQTGEHLEIIDALLTERIEVAAKLMERHISGAGGEKAKPAMFERHAGDELPKRERTARVLGDDGGEADSPRIVPTSATPTLRP